ncbi:serine/threonine protein kinase [Planctomicrobium sp. SH661]|uniref:serine/threonine protein kinase n=1 Tax=Planctomicrobium sp. SH661 TaxID=3448124 RepID=UPI003F5C73FE
MGQSVHQPDGTWLEGNSSDNCQSLAKTVKLSMSPETERAQFAPGTMIGKYSISQFLGRGGMGEVYLAIDSLVEREIALKVLPAHLLNKKSSLPRFLAEARAVGKLMNQHTVTLFEIGEHEGGYFLAMEFVGGGSIADLVAGRKPVAWGRATRFAWEVTKGLASAHAAGLIHRDIKPENLLRTNDDHIKITDFGLAKSVDPLSESTLNLTCPGDLLGTPYYMSPEQFMGEPTDARTDIYSLGATYYQMLTGCAPYDHLSNLIQLAQAHCHRPPCDPRGIVLEIPQACADIVTKSMAKDPADRFQSAHEMGEALRSVLVNAPPSIWLVEPSLLQARATERQLRQMGVNDIRIWPTISATVNALRTELPGAILSAMHFDDGVAEDLLLYLRHQPGTSRIPCFLISSAASAESIAQSLPGRPPVLPKPLTRESLSQVLRHIANP